MIKLGLLITSGVLITGCGARATTPSQRLRAPLEMAAPRCNERTVETFTPTTGTIRSIRPMRDRVSAPAVLSRESFVCGDLEPGPCIDSAADYAQERAFHLGRSSRLMNGKAERGRQVVFRLGKKEVTKTFASGADLIAFVRNAELDHESIEIVSEAPIVQWDFARVDIEFRTRQPEPRQIASADVVYEVPEGRRAKWEALRSFEDDLSRAGLALDDRSLKRLRFELLSAVQPDAVIDNPVGLEIRAKAASYEIPDASDQTQPPLRLNLHVRCQ